MLRFFCFEVLTVRITVGAFGDFSTVRFGLSLLSLTSFRNFSAAEAGLVISFVFYPRLTFFFHFFQHSVLRCMRCAGIS